MGVKLKQAERMSNIFQYRNLLKRLCVESIAARTMKQENNAIDTKVNIHWEYTTI